MRDWVCVSVLIYNGLQVAGDGALRQSRTGSFSFGSRPSPMGGSHLPLNAPLGLFKRSQRCTLAWASGCSAGGCAVRDIGRSPFRRRSTRTEPFPSRGSGGPSCYAGLVDRSLGTGPLPVERPPHVVQIVNFHAARHSRCSRPARRPRWRGVRSDNCSNREKSTRIYERCFPALACQRRHPFNGARGGSITL